MSVTWAVQPDAPGLFFGIRYGNGVFIAVAGGELLRSTDGITWAAITSGSFPANFVDVGTDGAGTWIAVGGTLGSSNAFRSTDDGVTWAAITNATLNALLPLTGIAYGNGLWVIGGGASLSVNNILTSADGLAWTSPGQLNCVNVINQSMLFDGTGFACVITAASFNEAIASAPDPTGPWDTDDPPDGLGIPPVVVGGVYYAANTSTGGFYTASTMLGLTTAVEAPTGLTSISALGGGGPANTLLAFASNGGAASSADGGATWSADTLGFAPSDFASAVVASPTLFVAGSSQTGAVATSGASPPVTVLVPDVVGETADQAAADIVTATLTPSGSSAYSSTVPPGIVISQDPAAGTSVSVGSEVSYVVSNGPLPLVVPNVVGMTGPGASATITQAQFSPFALPGRPSNVVPAGLVLSQSPGPGTIALAGATVTYTLSLGPATKPLVVPFDFEATVISQYANSPTLLQLVQNCNQYLRQDANFQAFFDFVFNVDTAQGFGLDYWGRIVDISRLLEIQSNFNLFGFQNTDTPPGVLPFNQGVFNVPGNGITASYELLDDSYRTLILVKALANISATTAPAVNNLLRNLFPGRGKAYVLDLGNMAMQYTFEFQLTPTEYAILSQSGAIPHPAGVKTTIVTIADTALFGFAEAGPTSQTFGNGAFYVPPGL